MYTKRMNSSVTKALFRHIQLGKGFGLISTAAVIHTDSRQIIVHSGLLLCCYVAVHCCG